jgi:hypothetical protein
MKKTIKHLSITGIMLLITFFMSSNAYAQDPGSPTDPSLSGTNGQTTGVVGGQGASVDGGMNLFLLFALAYGTKRYLHAKKKEKNSALEGIND